MDELLVLDDGIARVEIHPSMGGSVGRYDYVSHGAVIPVFDVSPNAGRTDAFALGCQVMIPFANRISGGGFWHDGQFHPLAPNNPSDQYPNHGNGFQSAWVVEEHTPGSATLALKSEGPGPFRYDAQLTYTLRAGALSMRLIVTNRADISLPYGVGFHPWFTRTPRATLTFSADGCWTEHRDHLPDSFLPLDGPAAFDFRQTSALPERWINMAFTGWDQAARLDWPEHALGVTLTACTPLSTLMVYSPSNESSAVCIEPVSHSVDAHNRTEPGTAPPQVLAPGQTLTASATITPQPI
ncbi:hypothetical protein WH87_00440 [Devosia epidermidihirudinis]|uniref:Aldose epimerase n=1 Tax=Devosia epidermidihirudinis TaxID=1293439 RepID=A0A0F5QL53_9HYPH|nr:aldose 1-epimerase [Devosia epidermidihirudinis]KKC41456.1 hypothetical protein WH87_00440 [Devosia epidermidihirudinis]